MRITDPVLRSEGFMREYHAAVRDRAPAVPAPAVSKGSEGTLGWLIKLYHHSRAWTHDLSAGTRKQRGPILKQMETTIGDIPLEAITRAKVEDGMSERTENQARHFVNTVSGLFNWAIANDHHDGRNPADGIKRTRNDGGDHDGHRPWTIEVIQQFERRWPVGTKERLIFDVYLYVGLRRGDAARLGKQHCQGGVVHLMTEKSQGKMPIFVPVHPALAASMAACPTPGLAIIANGKGANYSKESLGNLFREAIAAAGIPVSKRGSKIKGYSAHGLRKASATIAAESGATESELNAMFGWTGYQMAQLYTRKADRRKLAARAMAKWARPTDDMVGPAGQPPQNVTYLQLERQRDAD